MYCATGRPRILLALPVAQYTLYIREGEGGKGSGDSNTYRLRLLLGDADIPQPSVLRPPTLVALSAPHLGITRNTVGIVSLVSITVVLARFAMVVRMPARMPALGQD